ncbi:MAG: hypothetical protein M1530_00190, partial [Candidatus Marsarchaeota archaeon]|nr:hypothetical protein [Candidatus Marsarchaeota archaeon]
DGYVGEIEYNLTMQKLQDGLDQEAKKSQRMVVGYNFRRYMPWQEGLLAQSVGYAPKKNANGIRAFGYYLEAVAIRQLCDDYEIRFLSTGGNPKPETRRKQLNRVNLRAKTPYPARDWLLGLGRGIRKARDVFYEEIAGETKPVSFIS